MIKLPWLPTVRKSFTVYAITVSPFVFIRKDKATDPAIIAHEQVHLDQVKEWGWFRWYYKYITDPVFRREQEEEAYEVQHQIENNEKEKCSSPFYY